MGPGAKAGLIVAGTMVLGAIVGIAVSPMVDRWANSTSGNEAWPKAPNLNIELPDNAGRLHFYRRGTHLYLAEYDRRLEIIRANRPILKQEIYPNTGGQTFIKLYWYPGSAKGGPYLRLQDDYGQIVVSLGESWVQRLVRYKGQLVFVWPKGDYGVTTCDYQNGERRACGMNGHSNGIEYVTQRVPAVIRAGPGRYYGLIDGRFGKPVFVPATLNSNPQRMQR